MRGADGSAFLRYVTPDLFRGLVMEAHSDTGLAALARRRSGSRNKAAMTLFTQNDFQIITDDLFFCLFETFQNIFIKEIHTFVTQDLG